MFQFTPLREGRPFDDLLASVLFGFNSRPCVRGDISKDTVNPERGAFQFTPLREGRRAICPRDFLPLKFQFTPLREGRRAGYEEALVGIMVSIHAPA